MRNSLQVRYLTALGLFLASTGTSRAVSTINSIDGTFTIQEYDSGMAASYFVDLLLPTPVHGVAIAFVDDGTYQGTSFGTGFALMGNWNATVLSEAAWDNPTTNFSIATTVVTTNSLGSFDSLFGTTNDSLIVFSDATGVALDESTDEDLSMASSFGTFLRDRTSSSTPANNEGEAILIGQDGSIAGRSYSIPEPGSLSLLGLCALFGLLRRQRLA